ncbi:class I adenylate-forming enzyme family protein [Hyphococcus sp.]|uniref:class I adenylate-forming enzyme family protein n=1 Tax=Hyphococcus sp. TaxID=2038636 RepID=UPI0035C6C481
MNAATDVDELMRRAARRAPEREALRDSQRNVIWAELDTRINKIANAMISGGVARGDTVAILAHNSVAYAEVFFGALRAGACVAPLSSLSSSDALVQMIADSGARYLFTDAANAAYIEARVAELPGLAPDRMLRLDGASDDQRSLVRFIAAAPDTAPDVTISPDDGFNLIYSSGTTGMPKGIMQPRRFRAREARDLGGGFGFDETARLIVSTPLCSNTSLTLFFAAMAAGGSAVIMEKFDTVEFLKISEHEKITHAMLVPVQYVRLLADPKFDDYDLSSYRGKFCTSAPLYVETKREILARWPDGGLVEAYGLTEGGIVCLLAAHEHPDKLDTVGIPAPDCDLRIIGEDGKELPQGSAGEIIGRSSKMMTGYHNRDDATAEASWYDADGNRFHRSGDIGWLDEDGFLHLLDRKKDMIISGGFNIYAVDLENVLLAHPDVADAAVIGAPSKQWGETPVAFVVLHAGAISKPEELRDWANARLGKVQRISALHLRPALPRSSIGKILKREIREWLAAMPGGAL